MEKFAQQIENNMAFLMSGDLRKSLNSGDAIQHLSKALSLLENCELETHCSYIRGIIKRAESVDESNIEVSI